MIRSSDLTWTIIDEEGMETNLDAADIQDFRFRWGAHQNRRRAPQYFSPSGRLVLNRQLSEGELASYHGLKIEAGGEVYFDIVVADYEAETGSRTTNLLLQSRGAADGDKEIEWGLAPQVESPAILVDNFVIPGLTLATELMAPLARIGCVSAPDPNRDVYKTRLRRILGGLESLGWFVLIEDVRQPAITCRALPMPLNADSDHRPVATRFGGYTHLIDINRYTRGLARHWSADRYNANVGGSPFNRRRVTFSNLSINSSYSRGFGYYLGAPFSSQSRARVWTAETVAAGEPFAGFSNIRITMLDGAQPASRTYVAPDGSYAGVVLFYDGDEIDAWGYVDYYIWDSTFDTSEWELTANGKDQAEKRALGNTFFTVYQGDNNPDLMQALIDAWDEWYPNYARLEFLVEDLSTDSPARYIPGDRIGLDVSDLSHHAVIMTAEWRLRGNRPLRITWDVLTQEEIPDARLYLGDANHPLFLGDIDHGMYLER